MRVKSLCKTGSSTNNVKDILITEISHNQNVTLCKLHSQRRRKNTIKKINQQFNQDYGLIRTSLDRYGCSCILDCFEKLITERSRHRINIK